MRKASAPVRVRKINSGNSGPPTSSGEGINNTIIIISADPGESLGENNYYFEHGMLVNEGSIHIPLIISHP